MNVDDEDVIEVDPDIDEDVEDDDVDDDIDAELEAEFDEVKVDVRVNLLLEVALLESVMVVEEAVTLIAFVADCEVVPDPTVQSQRGRSPANA